MNIRHLIGALLAAAVIGPAFAQTAPATGNTNTPRIDKREANQAARIEQGKASGALTDKEAARLDAGQAKVAAAEDKAKADGKVTKKERTKLRHMEDKQSRHIAKQKHDKQVAPPAAPAQ